MKINKIVSKGLSIGFLLNSLSILSYANTEIPNRYETLEGEYITINDSTEGNLEEIEIFGNIVQNNNDSKNIFGSPLERGMISLHTGEPIDNNSLYRSADFDNIKPSTEYIVSVISGTSSGWIYYYDESYGFIHRQGYYSGSSFVTPNNAHYFKIQPDGNCRYIQVEEGSKATSYTPYHKGDLSNIESVGELYVDENGNPILNNKGQRQYKIDIHSTTNLWSFIMDDWYEFANNYSDDPMYEYSDGKLRILRVDDRPWTSVPDIKVPKANTKYTFSSSDNSCTFAKTVQNPSTRVSYISDDKGYIKGIKVFGDTDKKYDVKLVEGDYIDDILETSTTTIILPTQLQRVGDVADRLYWDSEKRKYIIEKNIEKIELDGTERWNVHSELENTIAVRVNNLSINPIFTRPCINDSFPTQTNEFIWDILSKDEEKMIVGGGTYEYFLIRVLKDKLETPDAEGFKKYLINNPITAYYQTSTSRIIETNITSKLKVPTYEGKTHVFVETENGINPTLKVVVDRLDKIAENAIEEAENNSTSSNISLARMYVNMLPESLYKDQLQNQLSDVFSSDMVLDKKNATSNLDLYIKCENILMMSLSTNSITFEDFSGIEDMEKANAVNISINSSLPYQLNAYLPTEIQNSNKSTTMNKDILNIKENSESVYQTFANTTDKIILKDNCNAGNNLIHGVDIKLKGGIAHEKDVYKTTIKLEAEQK